MGTMPRERRPYGPNQNCTSTCEILSGLQKDECYNNCKNECINFSGYDETSMREHTSEEVRKFTNCMFGYD
jgi:hypothetical protein